MMGVKNKKDMMKYVVNFSARSKNCEVDDLITLTKKDLRNYLVELEDKDYYLNFLGCIICHEEFNNFAALFMHLHFSHSGFDFYHCVNIVIINFRK